MEIVIRGKEEEVTALIETIQGKRPHTVEAHIDGERVAGLVRDELHEYLKKATGDTATANDVTNIPRVAEMLLDHATRLK